MKRLNGQLTQLQRATQTQQRALYDKIQIKDVAAYLLKQTQMPYQGTSGEIVSKCLQNCKLEYLLYTILNC